MKKLAFVLLPLILFSFAIRPQLLLRKKEKMLLIFYKKRNREYLMQ